MIQSLYFPEIGKELLAIQQAQIELIETINENRLRHMKSKEAFIAEWNNTPFMHGYERYLAAVNTFVLSARTLLGAR